MLLLFLFLPFLSIFSRAAVVNNVAATQGQVPSPPMSIVHDPVYNVSLPPFPIMYSDAEKEAQAEAGDQLLTALDGFFKQSLLGSSQSIYTVQPGVYRIRKRIEIPKIQNVKLVMQNVELITTLNDGHFTMFGPNNLEIAGPLVLDADPMPHSQSVIVGSDYQTYIDVTPMLGYPKPRVNARIMGFTPDGRMQKHWQDPILEVTDMGNNVFRIKPSKFGFSATNDLLKLQKTFAVGNYLATESNATTSSGGINLQAVGNLYMHDIYFHSPSLLFCQNVYGVLRLDRYMGQRRPGTNRLDAGGWPLCQFRGGAFDMTNSELSYNYDDLTDIEGYFGVWMQGPQPNQLYSQEKDAKVGESRTFYDAASLQNLGTMRIISVDQTPVNQSIQDLYVSTMQSVSASSSIAGLVTITVDGTVTGGSRAYIADNLNAQPQYMSVKNSYLHDSLAAGFQMRAAKRIDVVGNVIARSGINCLQASFSTYWVEGGVPANINFQDNWCIDAPYNIGVTGPSIAVFTESAQMQTATATDVFQNISISGNTIINPMMGAILVSNSANVIIANNRVYNAALQADTRDDKRPPYIISVQTSRDVSLQSNIAVNTDGSIGYAGPVTGPSLIVVNDRSNKSTIHFSSNHMLAYGQDYLVSDIAAAGNSDTTWY